MKTKIISTKILTGFLIVILCCASSSADDLQKPEAGKKIKVFLLAGQSNMEGRANGYKLTEEDLEQLHAVQDRIQLAYNGNPVHPLDVVRPPKVIEEIYKYDRIFGPEIFFGIAMAEIFPDEKFLFIKKTAGGTSLLGCWNPDWNREKAAIMKEQNHPRLYGEFIQYTKEVLKGFSPEEYEVCGMFWVQGERDAKVPEAEEAYGKNLYNLITRVRTDLGLKDLPFIFFKVGSEKIGEGMKETADQLSNVTMIPQSLKPDSEDYFETMENGHYNINGFRKLGARFADVYLQDYNARKND